MTDASYQIFLGLVTPGDTYTLTVTNGDAGVALNPSFTLFDDAVVGLL